MPRLRVTRGADRIFDTRACTSLEGGEADGFCREQWNDRVAIGGNRDFDMR
jgi:hypothetical protein